MPGPLGKVSSPNHRLIRPSMVEYQERRCAYVVAKRRSTRPMPRPYYTKQMAAKTPWWC